MKLLEKLLNFIILGLLYVYLFLNITGFRTGGTGYTQLVFLSGTTLLLFTLKVLSGCRFRIRPSGIFLLLFLGYFLFRILIDLNNLTDLRRYALASNNGLIFSYTLGLIANAASQDMFTISETGRPSRLRIEPILPYILLALYVALLIRTGLALLPNLRPNILLLEDLDGAYQRPGSFLSMALLLASLITIRICYAMPVTFSKTRNGKTWIALIIYLTTIPIQMLIAQVIGSNNALLFTGVISFVTISFSLIALYPRSRTEKAAGFTASRLNWPALTISACMTLIIIGVTLMVFVKLFEIDVTKTRIMGFGSSNGLPSSVSSRLHLLQENLLIHLDHNTLFGDLQVDTLTTGSGTYIHSLPISIATHLGLLGFALFALFFVLNLHETVSVRFQAQGIAYRLRLEFQLYLVLSLLCVLAIATVSTFLTWMPFWFSLALLAPSIEFQGPPRHAFSNLARS